MTESYIERICKLRESMKVSERKKEVYSLLKECGIMPNEKAKEIIENYSYLPNTKILCQKESVVIESSLESLYEYFEIKKDGTFDYYAGLNCFL